MIRLYAAIVDKNTESLLLENNKLIELETADLVTPFATQIEKHLQDLFGPRLFMPSGPLFLQRSGELSFIYYMYGCPILFRMSIKSKIYEFVPVQLIEKSLTRLDYTLESFIEHNIKTRHR